MLFPAWNLAGLSNAIGSDIYDPHCRPASAVNAAACPADTSLQYTYTLVIRGITVKRRGTLRMYLRPFPGHPLARSHAIDESSSAGLPLPVQTPSIRDDVVIAVH